ncbi:M16 family metallopeptidase [Sinomicrobium soli]|uniref:M16 family metallopeptidase n=1 Tax=Sinomicrobium sp. N-1-3-6 TaxID=2219864 RepID=UPI001374B595|nr:insulinase family protein [Sinomicrobium sp. N-1-3-6]
MDPDLRYGKLNNGFAYYIRKTKDVFPEDGVYIRLVGRAGAWLETKDQQHLAHLMEHMNVLAPSSLGSFKYWYMNSIKHKVITSAHRISTGDDFVQYGIGLREVEKGLLEDVFRRYRALSFNEKMLFNLKDSDLVDELGRRTILEEIEPGSNYGTILSGEKYHTLGEPEQKFYDPNNILKSVSNIRTFKLKSLEKFYTDWYRPDMQALIVIGDIPDVDWVEDRIKFYFSDLKLPKSSVQRSLSNWYDSLEVSLPGTNRIVLTKDSIKNNNLLAFNIIRSILSPTERMVTYEQYREALIADLYLSVLGVRLNALTRQYRSSIPSTVQVRIKNELRVAFHRISVPLFKDTDIREITNTLVREMERIKRFGFSNDELLIAKDVVQKERLKQMVYDGLGLLVDSYKDHFMKGVPAMSLDDQTEFVAKLLTDIEVPDINAYARSWWDEPNKVLSVTTSDKASLKNIPTDLEFNELLESIHNEDLGPWDMPVSVPEKLLQNSKIPEQLTAATAEEQIPNEGNAYRLKFSNGISVILKPLPNSKNGVALKGYSAHGASSFNNPSDYARATEAANIIQYSGAGDWDKFQINAYLKEYKIGFSMRIMNESSTINASSSPDQIEAMLQLVYLYLTKPRKDALAFMDWKTKHVKRPTVETKKMKYKKITDYPLWDLLGVESPGKSFHLSPISIDWKKDDLDAIHSVYQQLFSSDAMTFVITGDFDVDKIRPLLSVYFGNLPMSSCFIKEQPITEVIKRPIQGLDKTFFTSRDNYGISYNYVGNLKTKKDGLLLELLERLLDKNIYSTSQKSEFYIGLFMNLSYNSDSYRFFVGDNYSNNRTMLVDSIVRSCVNDVKENLLEEDQLNVLKQVYKQELTALKNENNPSAWAEYLLEQEQDSFGKYSRAWEYSGMLDAVTSQDIRDAARTYLSDDNISIIKVFPKEEQIQSK